MWYNLVFTYQSVVQTEWTLLGSTWEERVGKGVDSPESHTEEEGPLVI
jgi:hypothetical protein